ncbi:hypothetical protein ABZ667_38050 [Streptomyces lavendulae]|uniref:hypothetical protein n=1 Tax=Streptomyces lavendulae TaxID=1914 RepID=UPI0033F06793
MVAMLEDGTPMNNTYPCTGGCACLFYNSNFKGATIRQGQGAKPANIPDYAPYNFYGEGAGSGQGVKNNAASGMSVAPVSSRPGEARPLG